MTVAQKYATWLDLIGGYIHGRSTAFPRVEIQATLAETFSVTSVSWSWMDDANHWGIELDRPVPGWPTDEDLVRLPAIMRLHPLLHWFEHTRDPKPMTVGRVPHTMAPAEGFCLLSDMLTKVDNEQQLAIPYELGPSSHRAFFLGRSRDDFTTQELDLAERLQPLLCLASRQAQVADVGQAQAASHCGLTGREHAVLRLLARGGTAQHIAHRLGISPRTVHTHLAHIYRKLGVDDRVRAVVAGHRLGLLSPGDNTL
jgi:DNA-binding CsgD family transcriptional regulator